MKLRESFFCAHARVYEPPLFGMFGEPVGGLSVLNKKDHYGLLINGASKDVIDTTLQVFQCFNSCGSSSEADKSTSSRQQQSWKRPLSPFS
ncbi:hypothetical protein Q7C36_008123 [Tachysurus vachellii]|uniref:Uncharacterized protein n=1 Tax=Tachysurus vachellii TaxID=175792 RepID=A0AA88N7W3_TACVA|nr:hypothetical protein Q7C36_008123 [Tachysurus vachellii]